MSVARLPPFMPLFLGTPATAAIDWPSLDIEEMISVCASMLLSVRVSHRHLSTIMCPTSKNVSVNAGSTTAGLPPTMMTLVSFVGRADPV